MTPIIFLFLSVVKTRSYHLNPTWKGEKKKAITGAGRQGERDMGGKADREGKRVT